MTRGRQKILTEKLLDARSQLSRRILRNRHDLRDSAVRVVLDTGDRILENAKNNYLQGESSFLCLNLKLIDEALERIELGTYGRCSECGKAIQEKRLSAVPWASLCVSCQRREEAVELSPRLKIAIPADRKKGSRP
jgi:DnaK suppressor protein